MPEGAPDVRDRLLQAWRGEVEAGAVYELIAQRLDDRRAEILRNMAQAEGGHRRRLEARMNELGIAVPDSASVQLSPWMRMQARIAPVDRLLAAREAAEDDEVGFVLTAGLAGAVASALSMATGAFLAERSEAEVVAANVERERQEIVEHPEEEKEELSLFYQLKGVDPETADKIAERLADEPEAMLRALATEEFGGAEHPGNPTQAAVAAGLSTGVGAIIPVIPFIFSSGTVAIIAAAIISLVAHFLVGAAKSLVTLRTWWAAGLEMTVAGIIVGGATYVVGLAFPT